jgi:hypothetical protein
VTIARSLGDSEGDIESEFVRLWRWGYLRQARLGTMASSNWWNPDLDDPARCWRYR